MIKTQKLLILAIVRFKDTESQIFNIMLVHLHIWLPNLIKRIFIIKKLKFGHLELFYLNVLLAKL